MTYYLHQIRLWWWQMRLEGAELERDRSAAAWHGANHEVTHARLRIEELNRRAMKRAFEVA
jgi:hypothetical protein